MNGASPGIASSPLSFPVGRNSGDFSGGKSGTSTPVHFRCAWSHQTNFFRSLHGSPVGLALALLYMMRRSPGHAKPQPCPRNVSEFRERDLLILSGPKTPE